MMADDFLDRILDSVFLLMCCTNTVYLHATQAHSQVIGQYNSDCKQATTKMPQITKSCLSPTDSSLDIWLQTITLTKLSLMDES